MEFIIEVDAPNKYKCVAKIKYSLDIRIRLHFLSMTPYHLFKMTFLNL